MIISASRRTDIPAFYPEWFYNRIKEGFVYVRNPMNFHQVSKILLTSDVVDCIVFWTKNPAAMLPRLHEIDPFHYYFQFTINPYNQQMEVLVPRKAGVIETFKKLSDRIGSDRVIWRYDPILLSETIDIYYHTQSFEAIARRLSSYTNRCMISFIDMYKKTERNMRGTTIRSLTEKEILTVSKRIVDIAKTYNIEIQSCSEEIDLQPFGIKQGKCIDNEIIEKMTGYPLLSRKDKNQRAACHCIESIDIGEYDSCPHNCLYCYANNNKKVVMEKVLRHNPSSPLLIGHITEKDIIKKRTVLSLRKTLLFD